MKVLIKYKFTGNMLKKIHTFKKIYICKGEQLIENFEDLAVH